MSENLCRLALTMPQQVVVHGVMRPTIRGVPVCVKQYEVKKSGKLKIVRNTVNVSLLQGDSISKDLVCISLYDTKPFYL